VFDFFSFLPLFNVAGLTVSENADVAYGRVFIWHMVVRNLLGFFKKSNLVISTWGKRRS